MKPVKVSDWLSYADAGHTVGPANAPVRIVEFSDFQCPFCRRTALALDSIRARYGEQVELIYRHFPIERLHPFARIAAAAAACGAAQGRFQEFHDYLFQNQDSIGIAEWGDIAARVGIADRARFQACLDEPGTADLIAADVAAGKRLGVRGTPTVLVNGWRITGPATFDAIDALIRKDGVSRSQR